MIFQNKMLCVCIAGVAGVPALAQPAGSRVGQTAILEEVAVTAQRRTENLQDISVAASAFNADALKAKAVSRVSDLQNVAPSLSITDAGITLNVNIRGIGIASNSPNVTAGVATYVDGLFQPPIVQANSFYDLESIEVFRGPQGTFVGSNSTGGAIFINTRDPELGTFGGYGQIGAGDYGHREAEGALNIPVAEDLAVRLAGFTRNRDTYYDDLGPLDNDAGKLDEYGARVGVLWNPGNFELLLKSQFNDRKTGGYPYHPVPGTQFATFQPEGFRDVHYDEPTANRDRADITSLEMRYELDNGVVLRSLIGYQHKRLNNLYDVDASPAPLSVGGDISQDYFAGEKQLSQEINIISPTNGALDWVVGVYYQKNDIEVEIRESQGGFPTDILPRNERITTGYFAQVNYDLTPALELQLGGRHSGYDTEGTGGLFIGRGIPIFPPSGLQVADLSGDHVDNRNTGKVALNWTISEEHMVYGLASRGYKPGGFNSTTSEFDPEEVLSYEAGWKASFYEGRIRTQVTAYYNDYKDFQFNILETSTGFVGVENLDDMTIKGLEAQVQAVFGELSFDANIGYTDSRLGALTFVNTRRLPRGTLGPQCPGGTPSSPPVCFDYTPFVETNGGGDPLFAPELTYSLGVQYDITLDELRVTPRVNYAYIDDQYTYFSYSPVSDLIEGYALLSASLTLTNEAWKAELYGTNLTDEEYVAGQFDINEFYGAPREYGIRLGYQF
ncbi:MULTISPECIES: TonB-dependent receptor domain-containing protein [unclassified Microbulbifer]|uniref:TonB-dependent receptor n=1 Tax=unclassified Microbulbifer TaxID=2619833 RepID=UPI0027E41D88|nr:MULTISPECIES: TonB-dependent receptor [unclassified Microbulbifer]